MATGGKDKAPEDCSIEELEERLDVSVVKIKP